MFGSCLGRAASILGIAVGALVLAFAVATCVAYLVSPSYGERFADERAPVVAVDTPTHDGSPAARDARAVTAAQAKPEERAAVDLQTLEAAVRDNGSPSEPSARSVGAGAHDERSRVSGSLAKRQPSASATATVSASAPATVVPATVSAPSASSAGAEIYDERSTSASATVSASASATARPRSTIWWSWWWRSVRGG
jgi:hypothetical protein